MSPAQPSTRERIVLSATSLLGGRGVDAVSLDLVQGSAVDFVEDFGGSAFKLTNPNAASGCGCGSSFSV